MIKITNDTEPYLALLSIDWDFDNLAILNLNKRKMSFESKDLSVVAPLDPEEGDRYVELVREDLEDMDLDKFYKVTAQREDYIKPTKDGKFSWTRISSCLVYFDEALENWKHRLYEVSMRK